MDDKEKIKQFIEDNNLDFSGSGSELNANCVVIAGHACYLDIEEVEFLEAAKSAGVDLDKFITTSNSFIYTIGDELERVFNFAQGKSYGDWWKTEQAKKAFKF